MSGAASSPPRQAAGARPALIDATVAATVAAASLVLLAHGGLPLPNPHRIGISALPATLTVATTVPLLVWRRWPLLTLLLVSVLSVIVAIAGGLVWPPLGIAAAIYYFARGPRAGYRWPPRHQYLAGAAVVWFLLIAGSVSPIAPVVHSAVVCAVAWFAGERSRLRRSEVHELRAGAERAAREARRERELAVLEERARIARDLHDTTAHALNIITLRAGTARLRDDPSYTDTVLCDIEELARDTITDVDRVIRVLRAPAAAIEAPPGLTALDGLVRQHQAAGHHVQVSTTGAVQHLPRLVDQGVYRILQESLTNAARHGTGTTRVRLEYTTRALTVAVENAVSRKSQKSAGGHGVLGMRERAAAIGAELTVDQTAPTFIVRLVVALVVES